TTASASEAKARRSSSLTGHRPSTPSQAHSGGSARSSALLELDGGACLLELGLDLVGLFLVHALLDRLRRRVDEVLGLLEAEAGDRADDLDHLDLLCARAREDDVEGGLLLRRGPAVAARRGCSGDRDRSGGGDAPLLLDLVLQLDQLEDGHAPELLEDGVDCCHYSLSSWDSESGTWFCEPGSGVSLPSCSMRASISP